jgi:hypothetical protein
MKYKEIIEHNLLNYSQLIVDKINGHPSVQYETSVNHIIPIQGRVAIKK